MDTSKTYILQCEKAEEIQTLKPMPGNIFDLSDKASFWASHDCKYCGLGPPEENVLWDIWLPRQDQLQEMIEDVDPYPNHALSLLEDFWHSIRSQTEDDSWWDNPYKQFTSMEQLWLAFVMSQEYHKKWSGTDWEDNG